MAKNIYMYNCGNTYNYGSMMMAENFINYFNKITNEKNYFFIETDEDINVERFKIATGINEIFPAKKDSLFNKSFNKLDFIRGYKKDKNLLSDFGIKIDLVVVLGGDDFTEDYGWQGPILNGIKLGLLSKNGKKVVMVGQTMGPYRSFRKYIMKKLLSKITKIYLRETISYEYLKSIGLNNIETVDDLALLPLSKQELKEKNKNYITFCPSELIYRYSKEGNKNDWIDFNLFMIETLLQRYNDKKLILLAHVLKPTISDDRVIINELNKFIKDEFKNRVIVEDREIYPYQVRNYIYQSYLVVSSRMHPVISSIQCEIPAIAISYSTKYWGIIGKKYELEDYILDVRYMTYKKMKEKFLMILDKIDIEYETIQSNMREKNTYAQNNIIKVINEISNL